MPWHHVAAQLLGGALLANFVPHFVEGVSGRPFPTPFASPPFRGLSPPAVNVAWGLANLAAAYGLLAAAGAFDPRRTAHVAAAGFALASVGIARSAGRLRRAASDAP